MANGGTERYDGGRHEGPQRTSPYPMSRLAPAHDLVHVAEQIARADEMIGNVVGGKLEVIVDQIRRLQEEARGILDGARQDLELHRARCAFPKRVGKTYHLYRHGDGGSYFSMLTPEDWGPSGPPHEYLGSYRLEPDQSWTALEDIPVDGDEPTAARVRRLLAEAVSPVEGAIPGVGPGRIGAATHGADASAGADGQSSG
ncbi:MAG TPA: DUF2452 domain-containing protein [Polyangiaceae bacterium LLY-WYZ-14_1]|jgi:hypothetical protein|nr:DUF2452 domain-containing protein [Polyangiaceae bacterium LLY-WYZ-14_1]